MLAYMSRPPPFSDCQTSASMATSTMSLTILPSSPVTYNDAPISTLLTQAPSPPKRPRLTLNTNSLSAAFGKKATSLRLETLSAISPTTRNTFSNGHQSPASLMMSRPSKPVLTPLRTHHEDSRQNKTECSASPEPPESDVSSESESVSSLSTIGSSHGEAPYKLAYNIRSILANGPIRQYSPRRPTFAQSKPMFPGGKKVAFRAPLEEEVTTTVYTKRHSDIESSSSTISTLELSPKDSPVKPLMNIENEFEYAQDPRPLTVEDDQRPDNLVTRESCPATPMAGRNKKDRDWVWTLGPLDVAKDADKTEG